MKDSVNLTVEHSEEKVSFKDFQKEVLADYYIACLSRQASLIGRKEVLTGKAKFGIFGDGKEVPQLAMAKAFKTGDFRSGYYRDQTFIFATGMGNVNDFFSQLYAHPDLACDPHSAGRQMNAHFATRSLDDDGNWQHLSEMKNSSADASPTASQMARAVGLAMASKIYRQNPEIEGADRFSKNGDEVTFCTIGDASTSEGIFWEALNAAGVTRIPLAISIWDDGYGISVPNKYQTTKGDISALLKGFSPNNNGEGVDIYSAYGWDYPGLCAMYEKGIQKIRKTHIPAVFHIKEATQPQGHSTSGSHERYKSKNRLEWEAENDCISKMRAWILSSNIASEAELDSIETQAKSDANNSKKAAWKSYQASIREEINELNTHLDSLISDGTNAQAIEQLKNELVARLDPLHRDVMSTARRTMFHLPGYSSAAKDEFMSWLNNLEQLNQDRYNSHLYSMSANSALEVPEVDPTYSADSPLISGFEILQKFFDHTLSNNSRFIAFGEDLGKIGGVNQGFAGLQEKHGEQRVFDTGIREATIIGQGIGMAMRGLRPLAEIQYLDYLIYGLQPIIDDLATLQYRTKGGQKAPLIIRTRGHRLEGIWHTGSPIGMIINSMRGVRVLVPRNMVQAAGMYNTMLHSDEPALLIECLNGYRLKERLPDNMGQYTIPLGNPEVLHQGEDVTIVSYGSTLRIIEEAIQILEGMDISCELIDVQTLIPFDIHHKIAESLRKTNRLVVVDEDVPGGASAYILQEILEKQNGYFYLDSKPITITAREHRSAYASDGDYFSKPNVEDIVQEIYTLMHETDPDAFPAL